MLKRAFAALIAAFLATSFAYGQTAWPTPDGRTAASGAVRMCLDGSGNATICAIRSTARLSSSAASTNATNVKATAAYVYSLQGYNAAAYPVYLVLYDAATNPPVPGTTTIRKKIPIPAGAAFAFDFSVPLYFANGIGYAFTKNAADADTTAIASGDVLQFNMDYN